MFQVFGVGRLTRDPEVKYTAGEKQMCIARFGIAVDRVEKGAKVADFFDVDSFGRQAEFAAKYLRKGSKVILSGELRTDKYTNRDGVTVTKTYISADRIEFGESRAEAAATQPIPNPQDALNRAIANTQREAPKASNNEFVDFPDYLNSADLPFNI